MGIQYFQENSIFPSSLNFTFHGALININQQNSLIHINWNARVESESIKQSYQVAADLVRKFSLRNWLNDTRKEGYLDIENQNWFYRCLVPQLIQNKLQKMARVIPDDPLAMLVSCNILDKIHTSLEPEANFRFEIFTDLDHALYWLNE